MIVPRGGKSLIARISEEARVPVIKHLDGICHVYIDDEADLEKAIRIADNAKTHRYGVCNAMETLLVAQSVAAKVLPPLCKIYLDKGVELRGDDASRAIISQMKVATEEDWRTEYLAPILSVRVVAGLDEAISHINTYSSQHTDSIVTENYTQGDAFLARGGFEQRDGQRLDAFCRRLRIRLGRGDRYLHRQDSRARPGRAGGADFAEIHRARQRAGQGLHSVGTFLCPR